MVKRWLRKRRARLSVSDNAILIAQTLGEKYDTWEEIGVSSKRKPGDKLPPLPPIAGTQYRDDLVWIVVDDSIVGYSVTVKTSELGSWCEVYSTNNIGEVFRFNHGEWTEHIMEIAEKLRSKAGREHIARFMPLNEES